MTKPSSSSPFVTTLDLSLKDKLLIELKERDFEISTPAYTFFSAKKKGLSCTLFQSGKLVVQGKESAEFIEFFLEPEILKTFHHSNPLETSDQEPRIGIDESGKGDFFGPLCIAGVYVPKGGFSKLQSLGVKDSKLLTDKMISQIAVAIKKEFLYHIVKINPAKYNEIYKSFRNLNHLLAWGHATAIEKLTQESKCQNVIIDQFANESVVESALRRKQLTVSLTQRHHGEEDLAVAAASILARHTFVEGIATLSEELGILLPKGASKATKDAAQKILVRYGEEKLRSVCKEHFKTLDAILTKQSE